LADLDIALFQKFYPAKLLLFGEHTVLLGSDALAVPVQKLGGRWQPNPNPPNPLPEHLNLSTFFNYLSKMPIFQSDTGGGLFLNDINQLFFDSNIPRGYGAGSSGALTAAALDLFAHAGAKIPTDLADLKRLLGEMESFFHGASSGLDPLVSYLNKTILIRPTKMETLETNSFFSKNIFLLDTNRPRKAETMITFFKENVVKKHQLEVENQLLPNVARAIAAFSDCNETEIFEAFHQISDTQYQICRDMIPLPFQHLWRDALCEDVFRLKLCGAGGGGFILGFAKNPTLAAQQLQKKGFKMLSVF
jgi:mevalonate kinase